MDYSLDQSSIPGMRGHVEIALLIYISLLAMGLPWFAGYRPTAGRVAAHHPHLSVNQFHWEAVQ